MTLFEFRTKKSEGHMSIFLQSGAKGFKNCHLLKYYNVRKWGSRLTLGLDAARNMHYIQKFFK